MGSQSIFELLALSPPGWGGVLLNGAFWTIAISLGGYFTGLTIGLLGALGKLSGFASLRFILNSYTTIIRSVPELILIVGLYYAGTSTLNNFLTSIGFSGIAINGLTAAIVVLGVVQGAYTTEVIRGAILAIPLGQIEAARAFGMSDFLRFRRITLPGLIPNALPGLSNLWMSITKDSALIAVVGYQELTLAARNTASATKHYFTFLITAALMYLVISLLSEALFRALERFYRRGQALNS
jgi:polar amino acid transport system permease protein